MAGNEKNGKQVDDYILEQKMRSDRIYLLNHNVLFGIPANLFCAIIVFIGLYHVSNHFWLTVWLCSTIVISVIRFCFHSYTHYKSLSYGLNLNLFIVGAVLTAILWGIAGSLLMPPNDIVHQSLIIIIIIGVASGGLHTLQASFTASWLFCSIMILPLIAWFYLQYEEIYWLLDSALVAYFLFMVMVSWRGYKLLENNLRLKYDNVELVTQLSSSNTILEESESRFRSAFDGAAIGMALISLKGRWLKVNESLCQIIGYSEEELLQIDFQKITHHEDLASDLKYLEELLKGKIITYQMEKRYIHKNGSIVWTLLNVSLVRNLSKQPLYFISQVQNIDSQKKAEQELKYIAYHDVLTGLANRKQLDNSFKFAKDYAHRHSVQMAIIFMDLDSFKEINDNLGHEIGDFLLIELAQRLKNNLRSTDLLVRLGGDEFIIVISELNHAEYIEQVAQKILTAIAEPLVIQDHHIQITASMGISIFPDDGTDLVTLMKQADKALYSIKAQGGNHFKLCNTLVSPTS